MAENNDITKPCKDCGRDLSIAIVGSRSFKHRICRPCENARETRRRDSQCPPEKAAERQRQREQKRSRQTPKEPGVKWCNRGQHFVPIEQFNRGTGSDGLNWRCKSCIKSFNEENKGKIRASRKRFREGNRDHLKAQRKRVYEKHKEKILTDQRVYKQTRREQVRQTQKRCYEQRREHYINTSRKRYREKRDQILEYSARHWRNNRERYNQYGKMRRARKRAAHGECTREQWLDKCAYWGWRCYLCGVSLKDQSVHMEHRKPLKRGGSNWPANIAPACGPCNKAKHTKTEREYRALVGL